MLLAPLVVALAAALPPLPYRVVLDVTPPGVLPPAVERGALAEAAAIWARYGVSVECGCAPRLDRRPPDARLRVVLDTSAPPPGADVVPLGIIGFREDGTPGRVITVFVQRLMRLVHDARARSLPFDSWPLALREQALGRAIGRVVAHEIGHFVLRTRTHSADGLMRPIQRSDELVDWARRRYRLQ